MFLGMLEKGLCKKKNKQKKQPQSTIQYNLNQQTIKHPLISQAAVLLTLTL